MRVRHSIATCMLLTLFVCEVNGQAWPPVIRQVNGEAILELSPEMESALQRFNPDFKLWKSSDYSISVRIALTSDSSHRRASFALAVDANKDGMPDIILDGHDDRHCLLLCLLSQGKEYIAETLDSSALIAPTDIVSFDNGEQTRGLCYHLSPTCEWSSEDHFDPKRTFVFQIVYPQQSDSAGNVLNEGGSVSYYFEDGKFTRGNFDPL